VIREARTSVPLAGQCLVEGDGHLVADVLAGVEAPGVQAAEQGQLGRDIDLQCLAGDSCWPGRRGEVAG
jgi:hypothetical protein